LYLVCHKGNYYLILKRMNYLKKIKTRTGHIWLMNAVDNDILRGKFKNKIEFERYVVGLIVKDVIGNYSISHLKNGAPILNGDEGSYISISHSKNYFAVYYSKREPVGIDVEIIQKSLFEGAHYFLNEIELCQDWTNDELHIIWGVKEAFFKMKQGKLENLVNAITVDKINQNKIIINCDEEIAGFEVSFFKAGVLIYSL
jgi:4'-phosphopantetheinyl transferase